jgi:hypothetical protein
MRVQLLSDHILNWILKYLRFILKDISAESQIKLPMSTRLAKAKKTR